MDGLNKTNCAFALDRICKLDESACKRCKVDRETSESHKKLICGLTWDELMKMQYREK